MSYWNTANIPRYPREYSLPTSLRPLTILLLWKRDWTWCTFSHHTDSQPCKDTDVLLLHWHRNGPNYGYQQMSTGSHEKECLRSSNQFLIYFLISIITISWDSPEATPGYLFSYHVPPTSSFFSYIVRSRFGIFCGKRIPANIPEAPAPIQITFRGRKSSTGRSWRGSSLWFLVDGILGWFAYLNVRDLLANCVYWLVKVDSSFLSCALDKNMIPPRRIDKQLNMCFASPILFL